MEKTFQISEQLLNEILSILGNMPYVQTAPTIQRIQLMIQGNSVPATPDQGTEKSA